MNSTFELVGCRVAILATDGFEQSELFEPKAALERAGADIDVISIKAEKIKAWKEKDWGKKVEVDKILAEVLADDYDCLLIPGGVMNPDRMRVEKKAIEFVKRFMLKGKPIAAICHGPQLLIETGLLKGVKLTSYPSLKTDLVNAGARWTDEEVVIDRGLITSRSPSDIPAFNRKMIEKFAEGAHNKHPSSEGFSAIL